MIRKRFITSNSSTLLQNVHFSHKTDPPLFGMYAGWKDSQCSSGKNLIMENNLMLVNNVKQAALNCPGPAGFLIPSKFNYFLNNLEDLCFLCCSALSYRQEMLVLCAVIPFPTFFSLCLHSQIFLSLTPNIRLFYMFPTKDLMRIQWIKKPIFHSIYNSRQVQRRKLSYNETLKHSCVMTVSKCGHVNSEMSLDRAASVKHRTLWMKFSQLAQSPVPFKDILTFYSHVRM